MADRPIAYEGKEPYIFISYAHKDTKEVYEVLNELQKKDFLFWYDDGIAPGSEWPENIAAHLNASSLCMAFITPNSMGSVNCRREINFALSKNIPFLGIVLRETEMPLGMEMQLSAQQSILKYNYRTTEEFIQKILTCPDIQVCKKKPEPVVVAQEVVSTGAAAAGAEQTKSVASVPAQKIQNTTVSNQTSAGSAKDKKPLIIGGAALAAVVVIGIAIAAMGGKSEPTPEVGASSQVQEEVVGESAADVEETAESTEEAVDAGEDAAETEKSETVVPGILQVYADSADNKLIGNWADGEDRLSFGSDHTFAFMAHTGISAYGTWSEKDDMLVLEKEELFGVAIEGGNQETSYSLITDDMLSINIDNNDLTLSRTDLEDGGAWAVYYNMTPVTDLTRISQGWNLQVKDDTLPSRITWMEGYSDTALIQEAENGILKYTYQDKETEHSYEMVKGAILMVDEKPYFSFNYDPKDPVGSLYLRNKENYSWAARFTYTADPMLEVFFPYSFNLKKDGTCQVFSRKEMAYDGTWTIEDDQCSMTVDVNGEKKELKWTVFNNGTSLFLDDGETTVHYEMAGSN